MAFEPIDAAKACLRRANRFLKLAEQKLPDSRIKNDLRRTAIVTSIAAIDSYMHWLVFKRVTAFDGETQIPKALSKYKVEFQDISSLADSVLEQRRLGKDSRPWVQVKNSMQKQILKDTFQSFEQVSSAFALAGIDRPWRDIADEMGISSEDIKVRLNRLVLRRNKIVHEGDIMRSSRPRKLKYNKVDHAEVISEVKWVSSLIKAIDHVVSSRV